MQIVLFEDALTAQLSPITLGRPAHSITCGGVRLLEWFDAFRSRLTARGPVKAVLRSYLRDLQMADAADTVLPDKSVDDPTEEPVLFVNARLVPAASVVRQLVGWATSSRGGIIRSGTSIAAALAPSTPGWLTSALSAEELPRRLTELKLSDNTLNVTLLEYPHDIIRHHHKCLGENLTARIQGELKPPQAYREQTSGVFVGADVTINQYVVMETRSGPIVIEDGVTIGSFSCLKGPLYIGRNARVNEHSILKDGVSLGHTTKVGGEVECSIIEPLSNKQHHGFLGHSYLGSWINLGAGTSNSDLKNTYGQVNMEYGGRKVPTGMQFVGCFLGDYTKSAINTGIFTGKTIGVGSMLYGFVTSNVPSFVNYARWLGQTSEVSVEVLASTQSRMFARRGLQQRPVDVALLRAIFEQTRSERAGFGQPLPPEALSL